MVSDIKRNLLSVSQMTFDFPYIFQFSLDGFVINDRESQAVIATGSRSGYLYTLRLAVCRAFYSTRFKVVNNEVWHQQLGHPHIRIVEFLGKNKMISSSSSHKTESICSSCQMGKACRLPFFIIW